MEHSKQREEPTPWWRTLGMDAKPAKYWQVLQAYRDAAARAHPNAGGSIEAYGRVRLAYEEGRRHYGPSADDVYPPGRRYRGD